MAFAIVWKVLRQREQVEDVVQEVFLSIYLKRTRYYPAGGSVKTWIGQFSHFKAITVTARMWGEPETPSTTSVLSTASKSRLAKF
jgi:DNA-directed RNA polymerase specialized sigma24 family protein